MSGGEKIKKIKERLSERLDADLCADFYIEMRGKHSLSVMGCRGISKYGTEEIGLYLCCGELRIGGSGLICDSYTNNAVIISGNIISIELSERVK